MFTFGGVIALAFSLAWLIVELILALIIITFVYYMVFSFIIFIWESLHEPSLLYVKRLLSKPFKIKSKTKLP